jgi:hypothetical protein
MNKYLFMEIDGVLNHEDWFKTPGIKEKEMPEMWYDPECDGRINEIIERTGCKLIVTSIHRSDMRLYQFFKQVGLPYDFKCTPVLWEEGRGREIEYWLERFAQKPYTYAVVDDDYIVLDYMEKNFVQTANSKWDVTPYELNKGLGITESVKNRLIKILNNGENESSYPALHR